MQSSITGRRRSRLAATLAVAVFSLAACKGGRHGDGGAEASPSSYATRSDRGAGAASGSASAMGSGAAAAPADKVASSSGTGGIVAAAPVDTRKVIRTGEIAITVSSYDEARAKLDAMVQAAGGYVDSTQVERSRGQVGSATIVIRVPSSAFGAIVPQLRDLGEINSERTDAADVTDQYVDLSARLDASRTVEKRLLDLVANRTGSMTDVLAVEDQLGRVQGEIETMEGRLRQWDDQIALSTITLTLSTRQPEIAVAPVTEPTLGSRASQTFDRSVGALRDLGQWLLLTLISLAPWLPLLVPAAWLARRGLRKLGAVMSAPPRPPVMYAMPYTSPPYAPPPPPASAPVPPPGD